ncbi:hypothetical protein GCK72_021758 [Caenorhabditis remanei]|uniref:Uncharacterized protein n=1 Tax=Caenorhabditis remanei TaxID=31234 RepID=A0A6A5GLN5_CAERE|nr:hypothetical protein GCK72_021758 [Caenorhabditis remanei]KAF1755189.1 hypothetical protein GCK72_021758 [Caenorhabditis remanei]
MLGYPGLSWTMLGYAGLCWTMLDYAGLCWAMLGYAGLCWTMLDYAGLCWAMLGYPGLSWTMLGYAGLCWTMLDYARLCWTMLDYAGLCWTMLDYAGLSATTNKVSSEQAALLQLQEERLKIREEKLADDMTALRTEQLKVHELNLSLKDLVKNQQDENEREKWRTKEEWNRLKVEKQIFKENQDRIIGNIEKEKQQLAEELRAFRKNQNDLLFRVSTERELLEQERNEFLAKRDQDIKRIKSEAYELDIKSQQVTTADQHVAEMKLITETKYRQLQHLETLLTAECSEIERIRNEQKISGMAHSTMHLNLGDSGRRPRRSREEELFGGGSSSNQNTQRRSESVRASLKKHYEHLEKYAGQKVATVAPQNN